MTSLSTKMTNNATDVAEQVEHWIDDYIQNLISNEYNKKKRLSSLLKTSGIKKSESKILASWFSNMKEELQEVLDQNDPDLVEGWDFLTLSKISKLHEFVCSICEDFESYGKITKKKKKRKPEQIIKTLKYKDSANVGACYVTSFDPVEIISSKSFIALNVKTGDLFYYETDETFDVKGTTLQNFNDNSYAQRIGRHVESLCKLVGGAGIAYVTKELNSFKTKKKPATGRFNEHTVLLRVIE